MKQVISVLFIILLILPCYEAASQEYGSGIDVSMDGYVINLGGKIFFQPCEDSTKDIWQSLDNRSFSLWYFREDLYLESIENIGDSVTVRFYDSDDKRTDTSTMRFFFCSLEVDMMFLDSTRFEIFKFPKHKLICNKKEYPLEGFRVDNRIKKILPKELKNLRLMYDYYWNKGYTVPKWLDDTIIQNKTKND
jgi:hypothetical protein